VTVPSEKCFSMAWSSERTSGNATEMSRSPERGGLLPRGGAREHLQRLLDLLPPDGRERDLGVGVDEAVAPPRDVVLPLAELAR
jgi:hypothetical protein